MQRTLNAFETAFDRLAAGYFLVIALGVAAAVAGVVLYERLFAVGGATSDPPEAPAAAFGRLEAWPWRS